MPRQAKALSEKSYDSESELDLDAELVELERQEELQKEREQSKQIKAKPEEEIKQANESLRSGGDFFNDLLAANFSDELVS